ncbi:MAG TPA: TniQ family protein [Pyrinomonadaceae bacterium]
MRGRAGARGLSGRLWPAHIKPHPDELLSSWLVRLAMEHGIKLHTFCSIIWPRKQIWNRDIDRSADTELLQTLSNKTATPVERVRATTLAAYESVLYEEHKSLGPAAWITPVGIYHRTHTKCGQQFCPSCLAEDKEPYYRRKWRLAFMVACEKHHALLHDRCPQCCGAVNFHRDELGNFRKFAAESMTTCNHCGFDLRAVSETTLPVPVTPPEVRFNADLLSAIDTGVVRVSESVFTYSHLYFAALRQIMKVMAMHDSRVDRLRQAICSTFDIAPYTPLTSRPRPDVQELDIFNRRRLLALTHCLLEEWPSRFIELSRKYKVWSSLWLRNFEPRAQERPRSAPFWFWSVVHEHLYRAKYCPSEIETIAAIAHLKRRGMILNKSSLSRLLGVAVIRRKGLPC